MRKLLALLILSLALLIGGTDFAVAEKSWGAAPNTPGTETVGHEQNAPRLFTPRWACASPEPVIHFIELSTPDMAASVTFFNQMIVSGGCKGFPKGLAFWIDNVVAELKWFDGDLTYVVKGHDGSGFVAYSWLPASKAKERGVPPPGASELIPMV